MADEGISGATADSTDEVVASIATLEPQIPDVVEPRRTMPRWLWGWWCSPSGQPSWARPLLLLIAAVAGVAYGLGIAHDSIEPYYGASARSMSASWHAFIFGSFDPASTITIDKLPGAIWVQALSLRVFGFHIWAIVLPQVVEGVLTILVLYPAVRRLAGPVAGIAAAGVLAVTPVTVLLNRGNISDSLLILLLVLGADAVGRSVLTGRVRSLLLAGVWVGLAFQAKMLQAWLVLPAFALTYVLAAPAVRLRARMLHAALASLVTAVVSLSWMTAVSLVPAASRPFVDGSRDDSPFAQVFYYNGLGRILHGKSGVGQTAPFLRKLSDEGYVLTAGTHHIWPSWHRLLIGAFGRDIAWLFPAAAVAAVAIFLLRRGEGRRDPLRAAAVLWTAWLVILIPAFSLTRLLNSYYLAALTPALAALIGIGLSVLPKQRVGWRSTAVVAAVLLVTTGYALYLVRGAGAVPKWLLPAVGALFVTATVSIVLSARLQRWQRFGLGSAFVAVLFVPAAASATVVARGLGPFDTPFESPAVSDITQSFSHHLARYKELAHWESMTVLRARRGRIPLVVDTSGSASDYILFTGVEVLTIGGYSGAVPSPTLAQLQHGIGEGRLSFFDLPVDPPSNDPRILWVERHCEKLPQIGNPTEPVRYGRYFCARAAVHDG